MHSASSLLHDVYGRPAVRGDNAAELVEHVGQCWHCGADMTRGQPVSEWSGSSFTGQNRIRGGHHLTHVCAACVWVCSRSPGVVPGAAETHNWRLYTVLYDAGEVWRGSKGDKPAILAWLRAEKRGEWFAAIADSGQKHVVPYAPINPAGTKRGRVQFEEDIVALEDWQIVDSMATLLTAGATKDSIATGHYSPGEVQRCGWRAIEAFEAWAGTKRGGPWFRLALWLAQRDEEAVAARMAAEKEARSGKARRDDSGDGAKPDGVRAARPARGVSRERRKPVEALGSVARPDASGSTHVGDGAGLAHVDDARVAAREPEQCGLFGAVGAGGDGRRRKR